VAVATILCLPAFDNLAGKRYVWLVRVLWLLPCAVLWLWLANDWENTMQRIYPA
jgi:hypothetical protein